MKPSMQTLAIWGNALALVVLLTIGIYYWLFEESWLSYPNLPFTPQRKVFEMGDEVVLDIMRCNSSSKKRLYVIGRQLINDDNMGIKPILLPGTSLPIDPGCSPLTSAANFLPKVMPAGMWHIQGMAETYGTFHTFVVPWYSTSFKVVFPAPPKPVPAAAASR